MATVRLQGTFYSLNGEEYTVQITDTAGVAHTETIDLSASGFAIHYSGDRIKGSSVEIPIIVNDETRDIIEDFDSDLSTAEEGRFLVKILYKTSSVGSSQFYWCGYVLPELSSIEDGRVFVYNLTATDGIARLKGIDYKDAGDVPFGTKTIMEHLIFCLTQDTLSDWYYSGSDIFLRTVVNWHDDNVGAPSASVCPTTRIRFSGQVFAKKNALDDGEDWKFMSCYDVLDRLCLHFNARLYFSLGCYRFEQLSDRSNDLFYERRFDVTGALVSSSSTAGYDKAIDQSATENRIATNIFSYEPAIKKVKITYDHKTYKNWLEGTEGRWKIGGAYATYLDFGIDPEIVTDSNTIFKILGRVYYDIDISPTTYYSPWRQEFYIVIQNRPISGSKHLVGETISVTDNDGNPLNIVKHFGTVAWATSPPASGSVEVSTDFFYAETAKGFLDFEITSPSVPYGTTGFRINFIPDTNGAIDNVDTPFSVTLNNWYFTNLRLFVIDSDDPSNMEGIRVYELENPVSGNSEVIEITEIFGHAVKGWTDPKIQTSPDGSTWSDTDATWAHGTESTAYEFGQLLAAEIMSARRTPTKTISGQISGTSVFAHSRITTPDTLGWILDSGLYIAGNCTWNATWRNAGIDRITGAVIKKKIAIPPVVVSGETPGNAEINSFSNGVGGPVGKGNLALAAVSTNYISAEIPQGAVTSIPLSFAVAPNAYLENDDIYIVNPSTGHIQAFKVAATAAGGATSISVDSITTTEDFPIGCHVVYSALNKYTGQGGAGTNMPPGTATGQILRWDGSKWVAYSGGTDGWLLTWDTTNGWQAEAPPAAGVTGSGAAGQVAYWSGASAITGENNLWWDAANDRLGIGTATPSKTVHYLGSLYGISGQHQFGRYNQTPATPYSAVEFEGLQADPVSVSTPSEDAVVVIRAMTSGGTRASSTLAVGVWSGGSDAYGVWIQGRDRAAFNTYRPILMQPRGGKLAVGRVSSGDNSAAFTVRYPAATSSSGAGNYIANFESGESIARIGVSTGTDTVKGSFHYDGTNVISRLCNLDGGASATIRFSIGSSESSDKVVIMPTGAGRLGAGFASTTGLHSTLQSSGSLAAANLNTTGAPTFDETKFWVTYSGSTNQTWTLPTASTCVGRTYILANLSASSTITLSQSVKKANGSTFNTLTAGQWAIISPDAGQWYGFKLTSA